MASSQDLRQMEQPLLYHTTPPQRKIPETSHWKPPMPDSALDAALDHQSPANPCRPSRYQRPMSSLNPKVRDSAVLPTYTSPIDSPDHAYQNSMIKISPSAPKVSNISSSSLPGLGHHKQQHNKSGNSQIPRKSSSSKSNMSAAGPSQSPVQTLSDGNA